MSIKCKQCGYPVIEAMNSCPNCGWGIDNGESTETISCPYCGLTGIDANEEYCPECGAPLSSVEPEYEEGTDYPTTEEIIPICSLSPISNSGDSRLAAKTFEDNGEGVTLTRGNTVPSDKTIDQELQAHLFFYEGSWYIEEGVEDRRSTYVHAGKGIKLSPGDVIKLGEREFIFNIKME